MQGEQLSREDRLLAGLTLAIVLCSSLFIWRNYSAAFPHASVDLRLTRDQITARAAQFLQNQSVSTSGFRNLTLFDPDDGARLFLEREAGLEEANRLMRDRVSVWRWKSRWYKPPEKEEVNVWLRPDGRLAGFAHEVEEGRPGARLAREEARALAWRFLRAQTALPLRLIEESSEEKPQRRDHVFTWEDERFRVKDAGYRRTVTIRGDRLGAYAEFLHVPEQWQREFSALRSKNELYGQIAQAFYLPLALAAVVLILQSARRRDIPWRPLALFCLAVGVLMVFSEWNNLPFHLAAMPTSTPHGESVIFGLLQGVGAGVGVFFYVILAGAASEPLYRRFQPSRLFLPAALSRRAVVTREFFRASLAGYGFAALHIAFIVAFYLAGRKFGVWTPQDVSYSDLLSTWFPWLYPMTMSLLASSSEEFWFRLLAIPLLKRLLRSNWLAILIPAFVWGFLHANYPQQPAFIRGIEVGLIGIGAGWLMLRFGILATLIWHYTVDAALMGSFLLQADSLYFRLSGLLVAGAVLLPLLASGWFYRRNRCFLPQEQWLNANVPTAEPERREPPKEGTARLEPLPPRWKPAWLALAAIVLATAGALVTPFRLGDFLQVRLTRSEAQAAAARVLSLKGVAVQGWLSVCTFVTNLDEEAFEYLRRQAGREQASRILRERTRTGLWQVRYFRPQQKEEWHVYLDQSAKAVRIDHILDEKAPGANLPAEAALRLAENSLLHDMGMDTAAYKLVDSSAGKKDNRTDHHFVWEDNRFRLGECRARVELTVSGDAPGFARSFLKLPENWVREFRRPRLQAYLMPALAGGLLILLLAFVLRNLGGHEFRWRAYTALAAAAAGLSILGALNEAPSFYAAYGTSRPIEDYWKMRLLGVFSSSLLTGGMVFLSALALDVVLQKALGRHSLPPPSAWRALLMAAASWGFIRLAGAIDASLPGDRFGAAEWQISGTGAWLAGLDVAAESFNATLLWALLTGTVFGLAAVLAGRPKKIGWSLAVSLAIGLSRTSSPVLAVFYSLAVLAAIGLIILFLRTSGPDLLSFAAAMFLLESAGRAAVLWQQPIAGYKLQAALAIGLAIAAPLVWGGYERRRNQSKNFSPGLR